MSTGHRVSLHSSSCIELGCFTAHFLRDDSFALSTANLGHHWALARPQTLNTTRLTDHQYDGRLRDRWWHPAPADISPVLPKGMGKELKVTQDIQWLLLCQPRYTRPEQLCRGLLLCPHVWACAHTPPSLLHPSTSSVRLHDTMTYSMLWWLSYSACQPS